MEGEPFTIVCNLFSKIYFVTIYLSFKKGKLLPTPPPKKKHFFFFPQQLLVLCLKDCLGNTGDIFVGRQSLGVGSWPHMESILGQAHSQPDSCGTCLGAGNHKPGRGRHQCRIGC